MFPFFTMVLFLQIRTCSCKFCFHHSLPTGLRTKFYNHISNNQSHDLDLQNSKKQNREREREEQMHWNSFKTFILPLYQGKANQQE